MFETAVRSREDWQNRSCRPRRATPSPLWERGRAAGSCDEHRAPGLNRGAAALRIAEPAVTWTGSIGSDPVAARCDGGFRRKGRGFAASSREGRRHRIRPPDHLVVAGPDGLFVPKCVTIRQQPSRCRATETISFRFAYVVQRNFRDGSRCSRTRRYLRRSRTLMRRNERS